MIQEELEQKWNSINPHERTEQINDIIVSGKDLSEVNSIFLYRRLIYIILNRWQ